MPAKIRTISQSGMTHDSRRHVALTVEYAGRLAHLEFDVEGHQSGQKLDDTLAEAELRRVLAALGELASLPEGQILPHPRKQ